MKPIKIQHLPDTRDFTTEYGVKIHLRLQDGETFLFRTKDEAEGYARNNNRYAYPVFENGTTNGFWAVSK